MKIKAVFIPFLILLIYSSCTDTKETNYRTSFNEEEQEALVEANRLIYASYYSTLITLDTKNQPRARVVEPLKPTDEFIIWIATNPKSRKVQQLKKNSETTLHYFDKVGLGYVSLMGTATLVDDPKIKAEKWKDGWERFYSKKDQDYLLIKFVPHTLELISPIKGFKGDRKTWKPYQVILRE